jgi:hypothetical protein
MYLFAFEFVGVWWHQTNCFFFLLSAWPACPILAVLPVVE